MAKAYALDLRERVFAAWQRGEGSQAAVATRFGVSERCGRGLVRRQRESGRVAAKPHGGGGVALATPEKLAWLEARVATHNDHTIAEHHQGLRQAGHQQSAGHGGPLAAGSAPDAKKKTCKDDEANTERVQGLRAAWPGQTAGIAPEDLIFMDESGVNRAMTRLYARSRVNTRAFGFAPRHWGANVRILGAISLRGALQPMCINGATAGRVFLTYLKEVLVPQLWPGAVVVMDNPGAHKVKGVREQIEAAGARLLYLPPYSADFNPIELL